MRILTIKGDAFTLKTFIDFDKSKSKIYINYYIEDFKIDIKIPIKFKEFDGESNIILETFDISNKTFLTNVN
ncbi:MAG: hypothetical protein ACFFCE_14700 [Promethearchaeota archaeon]